MYVLFFDRFEPNQVLKFVFEKSRSDFILET